MPSIAIVGKRASKINAIAQQIKTVADLRASREMISILHDRSAELANTVPSDLVSGDLKIIGQALQEIESLVQDYVNNSSDTQLTEIEIARAKNALIRANMGFTGIEAVAGHHDEPWWGGMARTLDSSIKSGKNLYEGAKDSVSNIGIRSTSLGAVAGLAIGIGVFAFVSLWALKATVLQKAAA